MTTQNGQEPCVSAPASDETKTIATLKAHFALVGHELHVLRNADGRVLYEVRRWGHGRVFSTVHDVHGFLAQIGGLPT
jgi:hypothetical protein